MQPKQQVIVSGNQSNAFASSAPVTVLGYAKTIVTIRNMGGTSGGTYRVQATPKADDSLAPWVTIKSSTVLVSGDVITHKVTDPWDAVRIQSMNTCSGNNASMIVWVNTDPR